MVDRLKEDHLNARRLAEGLATIEGININLDLVQTNMVYFNTSGLGIKAGHFVTKLKEKGILGLVLSESKIRLVTHKGIGKDHIDKSIAVIESLSKEP